MSVMVSSCPKYSRRRPPARPHAPAAAAPLPPPGRGPMTLALDIPRLETHRLVLRAPARADFEPLCAFLTDPARAWGFGTEPDRPAAWRWFAANIGHWALRGHGYFTIELKQTGAPCGITGIWAPEGWPEPELGWAVFAGFEGRGLAREGAARARDWAYDTLGLTTLTSNIKPGNTARSRSPNGWARGMNVATTTSTWARKCSIAIPAPTCPARIGCRRHPGGLRMTLHPAGVPVIETPGLVLRGYREADFEAFATFAASERSTASSADRRPGSRAGAPSWPPSATGCCAATACGWPSTARAAPWPGASG